MARSGIFLLGLVMFGWGCGSDEGQEPTDDEPSGAQTNGEPEPNHEPRQRRERDVDAVAPDMGASEDDVRDRLVCDDAPASTCVDEETLREYGPGSEAAGECDYPSTDTMCATGCCDTRCCELVPSNADRVGTFDQTGIATGPPDGVFDTDHDCIETAAVGRCEVIATGELDLPDYCVCRSDELTIGNLEVVGTRALVLLASQTITVLGTLSSVAGSSTSAQASAGGRSGAAGGSFGGRGGNQSDEPTGNEELAPLRGGIDGQDGCGGVEGGAGGGALQLSAGSEIIVDGAIIAPGGAGRAGRSGSSCNGGSGGGSGGAILIEAPVATIRGVVAANGGGGGSGGTTDHSGSIGVAGAASDQRAPGGGSVRDDPCLLYPYVYSGYGGYGGAATGPASDGGFGESETRCIGNTYSGDGGGGGSVGRIRVNTLMGAQACVCNGLFSPKPTFGALLGE